MQLALLAGEGGGEGAAAAAAAAGGRGAAFYTVSLQLPQSYVGPVTVGLSQVRCPKPVTGYYVVLLSFVLLQYEKSLKPMYIQYKKAEGGGRGAHDALHWHQTEKHLYGASRIVSEKSVICRHWANVIGAAGGRAPAARGIRPISTPAAHPFSQGVQWCTADGYSCAIRLTHAFCTSDLLELGALRGCLGFV